MMIGAIRAGLLFPVLAVFIFAAGAANAKTLYVDSTNGRDTVNYTRNSQRSPWKSIGRAVWGSSDINNPNPREAARAGDIVIVKQGNYTATQGRGERYSPIYNPVNNGSKGRPITIRAQGKVVLNSKTSTRGEPLIGTYRKNFVIWDGFIVDEVNSNTMADTGPVVIWSSDHIILRNITVQGKAAPWNDNHNAIRIESSTNSTVQNNTLYGIRNSRGNRNASAIMLYYSQNITIEHNLIHDSDGGIFVKGANPGPVTIRNNLLYNLKSEGVCLGGIGTSTAQNGARVYQNVIKDSTAGITFIGYDQYSPANVFVVNNTIDNCSQGGIFLKPNTAGYSNLVFKNNVIMNSARGIQGEDISDLSNTFFSHNLYINNKSIARINNRDINFPIWKTVLKKDTTGSSERRLRERSGAKRNSRQKSGSPVNAFGVDILNLLEKGKTARITVGAYISDSTVVGPILKQTRNTAP